MNYPKPLVFLCGVLLGAALATASYAIAATIATPNYTTDGSAGVTAFPAGALTVTPSDADVFARCVSIYVGVTGNVSVDPCNGGTAVTFVGVPAGAVLPVKVIGVNAASTTATTMIAVY